MRTVVDYLAIPKLRRIAILLAFAVPFPLALVPLLAAGWPAAVAAILAAPLATLGVLVGGVKRLRSSDGQLSLVCSDRNITKIFEITGLDRVFTIYPTRDDAVAKLGTTGNNPPV